MIELLIALVLGILCGIVTGLVPGVHVNMVSALLLSASPVLLLHVHPFIVAGFIVSMPVGHTFLDAVPSIFLGAPDADEVLNVLPGHRLLLEGKGYAAVKLTVIGAFASL